MQLDQIKQPSGTNTLSYALLRTQLHSRSRSFRYCLFSTFNPFNRPAPAAFLCHFSTVPRVNTESVPIAPMTWSCALSHQWIFSKRSYSLSERSFHHRIFFHRLSLQWIFLKRSYPIILGDDTFISPVDLFEKIIMPYPFYASLLYL